MPVAEGIITEIRIAAQGLTAAIDCPAAVRPAPGQYLIANSPDPGESLPVALFAASLPTQSLWVAGPFPAHWVAGTSLRLSGPLGNGFHLPPDSLRVALVTLNSSPEILLPLAHLALRQAAGVAFYCDIPPAELPAQIEVLQPALLAETIDWSDYMAAVLPRDGLMELRKLAGLHPHQPFPSPAEALLIASIPCAGKAACGVCAVSTRHGWKLACEDGPVFTLNHLEAA